MCIKYYTYKLAHCGCQNWIWAHPDPLNADSGSSRSCSLFAPGGISEGHGDHVWVQMVGVVQIHGGCRNRTSMGNEGQPIYKLAQPNLFCSVVDTFPEFLLYCESDCPESIFGVTFTVSKNEIGNFLIRFFFPRLVCDLVF